MAKKGAPSVILLILACAALYLPFQDFLQNRGYESSEEFFQDLVLLVVLAGIVLLPIVVLYRLMREPPKKDKQSGS